MMANRLRIECLKSKAPSSPPCLSIKGRWIVWLKNMRYLLSLCVGVLAESQMNMMMPAPPVIKGSFFIHSLIQPGTTFRNFCTDTRGTSY